MSRNRLALCIISNESYTVFCVKIKSLACVLIFHFLKSIISKTNKVKKESNKIK